MAGGFPGAVRSPFHGSFDLRDPAPFSGDDVDHTGRGIAAVHDTHGAPDYLDSFHLIQVDICNISGPVSMGRIIEDNTVQHHQSVFGVRSPDKHGGTGTHTPGGGDKDSGYGFEKIQHGMDVFPLNFFGCDHRDTVAADIRCRGFRLGD